MFKHAYEDGARAALADYLNPDLRLPSPPSNIRLAKNTVRDYVSGRGVLVGGGYGIKPTNKGGYGLLLTGRF